MLRMLEIAKRMWQGEIRSGHHDLARTHGAVGVAVEKFASRVLEWRGLKRMELRGTVTPACPHCRAPGNGVSHWEPWRCPHCDGVRPADDVRDGSLANRQAGLLHVKYHT